AACPFSQSVPQGRTGSATVSITSLNGFTGTVTLTNPPLSVAAGLPVTFNTTSVTLTSGGTKFVAAAISPTSTTAQGAYDLIVNATGVSGITLIHATDLNVTVTVPSFSIVAGPTSLVNPMGSSHYSTL